MNLKGFNIIPCIFLVQYCSFYLQGSILFHVSPGSILFLVSRFNIVSCISRFNTVPCISRFHTVPCIFRFNTFPYISRVQYCFLYFQGSILFLVSLGSNIVPPVFSEVSHICRVQCSLYFIFHISLLIPYISSTLHPAETTYLWQIGQFVEKTTAKNER